MIRRTTSVVLKLAAMLVAGMVALAMLGLWRLTTGPVELDFLKPYAARTVQTAEGPITFGADRVLLSWGGREQPLRITLDGVRATDARGAVVAKIPEASIDLSLELLMTGAFAPTAIVVEQVAVEIEITRDGLMKLLLPSAEADPSSRALALFVEQLLQEPNDRDALGRLNEVRISVAKVKLDDQVTGFVWEAPAAGAVLVRDADGVRLRAGLQLESEGQTAHLAIDAIYARDRENFRVTMSMAGLRPSLFANASPELAPLAQLDLPMTGMLEILANGRGEIRRTVLELQGGSGMVGLPGVFSTPRRVRSVALKAVADPAAGRLTIERLDVDFEGPTASMQGWLKVDGRSFSAEGRAWMRGVPTSRLAEFWPEPFAAGGRRWALANIAGGVLDEATAQFAFGGSFDSVDATKAERITADLRYRDLSIRYLPGLKPATGVAGTAHFDGTRLRFALTAGESHGVELRSGTIDLLELGAAQEIAEITVALAAPAQRAMAVLTEPALKLPKDLLYNPKRIGGDVTATLHLKFPLIDALDMERVEYSVAAQLSGFSLSAAIGQVNLTDATGTLEVNPRELAVQGKAKLDGAPFDIVWRESFVARAPVKRRYEIKGTAPLALLPRAGLPAVDPHATGAATVEAVYQVAANGTGEATVRAALRQTRLAIPELGWEKAAGVDGQLTLGVRLAGAQASSLDFDLVAPDLSTRGRVEFQGPESRWHQATLSRFQWGRTDLAGSVRRLPNGYAVDLKGKALDWARVSALNDASPPAAWSPSAPVVQATFDLERVLLKRGGVPARGTVSVQAGRPLAANVAFGGASLQVQPAGPASRTIKLVTADFGALLAQTGWLEGVVGGRFDFSGTTDDRNGDGAMKARIEMRDWRLQRSNGASGRPNVNAVIDALGRVGDAEQSFDDFDARIDKAGPVIHIRRAKATGASLGVSVQGRYDTASETIRLDGTVVPANAINSVFGRIPILGPVLGGQGGGLFAINFALDGPVDNPRASINPLSAIAPGIVRDLFGGGGNGDESGERGRSSAPRTDGMAAP